MTPPSEGASPPFAVGGSVDPRRRPAARIVGDYWALTKPRVMALAIFTGFAGLVAAPGDATLLDALTAMLFLSLGAGAAGALNMWYDADIDRIMTRTRRRPIAAGRLEERSVLIFGAVLTVLSVGGMFVFVNAVAAALLAATIAHYFFVYTIWLKRRTIHAVTIGGLAGALPPTIGWAAATGAVAPAAIAMAATIFLWTPPHSWALSFNRSADYASASIPTPDWNGFWGMRHWSPIYAGLTALAGLGPFALGIVGPSYAAIAGVLGLIFFALSLDASRLQDEKSRRHRLKRLFVYSIPYLFLIFLALMLTA